MGYYDSRNSGIVRLKDYKMALDLYGQVKPIRGRTPELRPLGHRRNTWYAIEKVGDSIHCKMYGSPIVTYHANGEIEIKDYSYLTTSTASFIQEVLGVRAYIRDKALIVHTNWVERNDNAYRVPHPVTGSVIFGADASCNYHYLRGGYEKVVHNLNRQNMKELRIKYKEVYDYVRSMGKLLEGTRYTEGAKVIGELVGQHYKEYWIDLAVPQRSDIGFPILASKVKELIDDRNPDTKQLGYNSLMQVLAKAWGQWGYNPEGYLLDGKGMAKALEKVIIGFHRDYALDAIPLRNGEFRRDSYGQYWTKGWDTYHKGTA